MNPEIKLPPLPEYEDVATIDDAEKALLGPTELFVCENEPVDCAAEWRVQLQAVRQEAFDYARAAVALNAPKWQPMSTAPLEDGARVLLLNEWGIDIACWTDDRWARKPIPRWISESGYRGRRYYLDCAPLGWMPLPPLPAGPEAA